MLRSSGRLGAAPKRCLLFALSLGVVLTCTLGPARAQSRPSDQPAEQGLPARGHLTSRGRWLVAGSIGGSWSEDRSGSVGALRHWRVYGWPSLSYFLRDGIGLGLTFGGSASEARYGDPGSYLAQYRDGDLIVGLQSAFDVPLAGRLSLLFLPSVNYVNRWAKSTNRVFFPVGDSLVPAPLNSLHMQLVRPALKAQLLVRLSPYVGISSGPDFWADVIVEDGGLRKAQAQFPGQPRPKSVRVQVGLSAGLLLSL